MNKKEEVLAITSYEAGYRQACEDFVSVFIKSHGQTLAASMTDTAHKMDESMKKATEKYRKDIAVP
jgi:prophage DNA circulation protein